MKQEEGKISLDLVPFMAKGIAQKAAARSELDAVYADRGIHIERASSPKVQVYNRYYRESDILTELYCQKATDFIFTALNEHDAGQADKPALTALEQMLKKCWWRIYTYVKASGPEVRFESFWQKLMAKAAAPTQCELRNLPAWPPVGQPHSRKQKATTKYALDGDFPVFWFLTNLFEKTITEKGYYFQQHLEAHLNEQERMNKKPKRKPLILMEPQKKLAGALWQFISQKLKGIPTSLNEYFYTQEYKQNAQTSLFKQENFGDLPVSAMKHVSVSRQELKRAIDLLVAGLPAETEVTDELKQSSLEYFKQILLVRACAVQYEKLRTFALEQSRLVDKAVFRPLELARLKEQLAQAGQKNCELEALLAKTNQNPMLEDLLAQKQNALNELQLKLEKSESAAKKEIAHLQEKLGAEREANQALRGLLDAEQQQNEQDSDLSPGILAQIALLKVVVLGGRTDWQQRVKQKYPNFICISSKEVKFDLSVLDAADVIVINWRFLGHSLFYRTMRYADKYNKKVAYLGNSNDKHLLQALYRECILALKGAAVT
ncbi:hypothetical protein [Sporomusa termitida]|uniref:DUF2325 domain-containing protein n=1 Tax=Sporomusa termitida TaxID=2377 RepID=A0A517DVM8_9FIRM|nr:hypothetical protein [Sporomusa termitida]QDR81383.1 hypothetical protein SPTER_27630 [Sporomusa termitida]